MRRVVVLLATSRLAGVAADAVVGSEEEAVLRSGWIGAMPASPMFRALVAQRMAGGHVSMALPRLWDWRTGSFSNA
jgi:hypothetical protein